MPDENTAVADQPQLGDPEQRPTVPVTGGIAGAEITQGPKLSEYLNHKLLICPLQYEEWQTTQGPSNVLVSHIITFTYTLDAMNHPLVEWEDLGETPVFWSFVQKQLDEQANQETPWVVGTLSKGSRAYKLDPPFAEDLTAAAVVLSEFRAQTSDPY